MRVLAPALLAAFVVSCLADTGDLTQQARKLELSGDATGARALLKKGAATGEVASLLTYAQFLDRHRDPDTRAAYEKALAAAMEAKQTEAVALASQRLIQLDLLANEAEAAAQHTVTYRNTGRNDLTMPVRGAATVPGNSVVTIPGPRRSFARMAALSPELSAEDFLGALARNVVTSGYQAGNNNEGLEPTEYLKLVVRYLSQARELEKLGGKDKILLIESCDSSQTADLLRVLGYRMRGGCGSEVVLETVNATRAFLTIDSGFPLADLEQALRTNRPFRYDYHPAEVQVLYTPDYWLSSKDKKEGEFIDAFLAEPSLCRLYLGMSKLDPQTADELRKSMSAAKIRAFAHVLDFYGGMFQIRNGKAIVPGGGRSAKAWADLVGASPDQGNAFFERLIARDDGWLASYFDSLARIDGPVRDYLTDPVRLKRFYAAIRGKLTSPGPARPVFRANADMMLLTTRMRLDPDGRPHIPGNLEVWKSLFINHPHGKYDGKLTKAANGWKEPEDLIEALFALSRKSVENEPLKIFMALNDLDRRRTQPLAAATVERLTRDYKEYGSQYSIFGEAPTLSDQTIVHYLDTAQSISQIRDQGVRADTAGTMQALVGLWQIFVRQDSITPADADKTLDGIVSEFGKTKSSRELFDGGRRGVRLLLTATKSPADANVQDRLIDLLAGASTFADEDVHRVMISDMIRTFEAQRLVSLKTIFDLADHLDSLAKGEKLNSSLINKTTARISEIQLPRAALSTNEKNALAFGYWTERHIDSQRKLNLRAAIDKAGNDPEKIRDVRGLLMPLLRDSLVGLNYVHYAPPGAQILQTNPLFVRSHDFIGNQSSHQTWRSTEVYGSGWPANAGGRLVGSMANLPYALAEAEQNFLIPSREQALIWGDLVPQMILSAKVPRYWNVIPAQLHWVGLHMRLGEHLVANAALSQAQRQQFLDAYSRLAPPLRVLRVDRLLQEGQVSAALEQIMPSELYNLATALRETKAKEGDGIAAEIIALSKEAPDKLNERAISRAFGTPKPTLTNCYAPELLSLRTFPTLMGYSSRIMAESWESSLLYYAALADELHLSPAQLNLSVPEWTQQTVEKIFATHLEDWPALLRSLRMVGDDVRAKARQQASLQQKAALQ